MKRIGFFVKRGSPEAGEAARQAREWLIERGCEPLFEQELCAAFGMPGGLPVDELAARSEVLVALGGDGTFLSASRYASLHDVPILGINLGGLGFLTETPLNEMFPMLELIANGPVQFETRELLDVRVARGGKVESFRALNDVVLGKSALARILKIQVSEGEVIVTEIFADGLIVSTTTGSTAYSMAAGGPICHPSVRAIILTPICPHLLANRPLLIPDTSRLKIELAGDGKAYVTIDGQVGREFGQGDVLEVSKSEKALKVFRNPNRTYYETLRDKLRWGRR